MSQDGEIYTSILHDWSPEARHELFLASFIRIIETVEHQPITDFFVAVIGPFPFSERTRLHITLTVSGTKKNILSAAALEHSPGYRIMLPVDTILFKTGLVHVHFKMGANLILHALFYKIPQGV